MSNTFEDMNDFIKDYGNIEEVCSETPYDILAANLSVYLTRPLTLFYAMQVLDYLERKELVIHVVTAGNFEELTLQMWEILLHLVPKTVSLTIITIGTELEHKSYSLSICDNCLSRGKKISLEFHNELYEDYVRNPSFIKPDIAVAFHADIQSKPYFAQLTKRSIKMLAKQNCPVLLTNHTQEKFGKSINGIKTILKTSETDRVYSGKNPFASLNPYRCIRERNLLVSYYNNFIAIYRSLCS